MPVLQPRTLLLVVSAPSGAGKTTLCDRLLAEFPSVSRSITCTTRAPRPGEVDGRDYYFLAPDAFAKRVEEGGFLEHAVVHGHRYGTPRAFVIEQLAAGRHVLLNIDVQGAASVRNLLRQPGFETLRDALVDVFVIPPSVEALGERLRGRGQDSEEVIRGRLARAEAEMAHAIEYQHVIVNDRLDSAYCELRAIFLAEQRRV
jgi:guanylate kinase